jgi:hypothetical protein
MAQTSAASLAPDGAWEQARRRATPPCIARIARLAASG